MVNNEIAIKALELCRNSRTVIPTNEILDYIIDELKKRELHIEENKIVHGDLLSKESVLQKIRDSKEFLDGRSEEYYELSELEYTVSKMPTDYDVKKVMEQINQIKVSREEYSEKVECNIYERGCIPSCYDCILSHVGMIVRAGGKE